MLSSFSKLFYSLWVPRKKAEYDCQPTLQIHFEWPDSPEQTVVVIRPNQDGPASVMSHNFSDGIEPQDVPEATGYKYLTNETEPVVGKLKLKKSMQKSITSFEAILYLLQGQGQALSESNGVITKTYPDVKYGASSFVSTAGVIEEQEDLSTAQLYTKVLLGFSNGFTSTQHFHTRTAGFKIQNLEASAYRRIDINTGICLFSKMSLLTVPGHSTVCLDKNVVPPIPENIKPTLYELESIARLSSAIGDVVALLGRPHLSPKTAITVNIDIPDFQYYLTACDLREKGLVNVRYCRAWIAAVDKRRRQLVNIMTATIQTVLKNRQLERINIMVTPGSEPIANLIKEELHSGVVPSLQECLDLLQSEGPEAPYWREFLTHLESRYKPGSLEELGRLVYVFKAVRTALRPVCEPAICNGKALLLHVDDVIEWKVFKQAETFLKVYNKSLPKDSEAILFGLFPMQKILLAGPGRSSLYLGDPSTATGLCLSPEKSRIGQLDVVSAAYGLRMGKLLQILCEKEGLR